MALWQANHVEACLRQAHPGLEVAIIAMTTEGDKRLSTNLASVGGKGLFMKELEQAILAGAADIAVHSMKDVTVNLPEGLVIAAACKRGEPRDAIVSNRFSRLGDLPVGGCIGTSSLRRKSQLQHAFPALEFIDLRGNVNTRLARLDEGGYDAIVLAAAGLIRLELPERIAEFIPVEQCLPAIGQGIVGVECRVDDEDTIALLGCLADEVTTVCLTAERSLNKTLGGGCHVPVAGYAELRGSHLNLQGRVGDPSGDRLLMAQASGPATEAASLGIRVASELLAQGADSILQDVYASEQK